MTKYFITGAMFNKVINLSCEWECAPYGSASFHNFRYVSPLE